jgi:hypothetical protein
MIARKWHDEGVRIVFDVIRPRAAARVAALLIQRPGERDEMFIFAPPPPRVGSSPYTGASPRRDVARQRWLLPRLDLATPSGGSVPTGEIRPFLPGELRHERRPDEVIDGEPCRVIASDVLAPWLNSGRQSVTHLDLAISIRTGVALRTRYYRNGRELRRVTTEPSDVELYGDRWLPTRRTVHNLENRDRTELILRNVLIDAELPDPLFTREALVRQNFPTF